MVSSSSFVSICSDLHALFRLAFASAPDFPSLTSPLQITRRLILQEARRQALSLLTIALRLFVSLWFQVLFHSPTWGTFHLSLTVLVLYRSLSVFSLGGWTPQLLAVLACTAILRFRYFESFRFRVPGSHRLWLTFPRHSSIVWLSSLFRNDPTTPYLFLNLVWASPISLATTLGILSLPQGT